MGNLGDAELRDWGTSDMRNSELGDFGYEEIQRLGDVGDEEFRDWEA